MRNRNGADPDRSGCGKKLERKQGRENINMVYYVGKKNLFSMKIKKVNV